MTDHAGAAMGMGFMVFYFLFMGFMMIFMFASFTAAALGIYDCARRAFPDPNSRGLWCLLILLTHWIGALVYYLTVYRPGQPPYEQPVWATPVAAPPPPPAGGSEHGKPGL